MRLMNYKGWIVGVTPRLVGDGWRARVEVWQSEKRARTRGAVLVSFNETADTEFAVIRQARAAARAWIDALPVDQRA
jgi:hypothetical protein